MKIPASSRGQNESAFTLIELLVVIAVIAILAAMVLPITGALDRKKKITVAQAELGQLETNLERYKSRYGSFPPDNPGNPRTNSLYLELVGSTKINNGTAYRLLDGGAQLAYPVDFVKIFGAGPPVLGLMNSSAGAQSDEVRAAENFLKEGIRPGQVGQIQNTAGDTVNAFLLCSVRWTGPQPMISPALLPDATSNPWHYNSSNPTNNPNSYDLWVDLYLGGKTNRISNWSKTPQVVVY